VYSVKDPDPAQITSLEDLAECLRQLHVRADKPSLRELEDRTKHANGLLPGTRLKRVRLGRTTLNDVLRGLKFPRKAFLLTFVEALNVDLEVDRRWEQAWDQLAVQYLDQAAEAEAEQLRHQLAAAEAKAARTGEEAEELRQQLTAAQRQAGTAESCADQEEARAQMAESRLDIAISRAAIAENLLKWERELSGSRFVSVTMPQLGGNVTEGKVIRWLKQEGDHVDPDEPLLEIFTGEGRAAIRAPVKGTIRAVISSLAGKTVTSGTVLAVIDEIIVSSWPVTMPQLDENVTEGKVIRWLKKEGDHVKADEPLVAVSTDEVDDEINSPAAGILRGIAFDEDSTVAIGRQLAVIVGIEPAGHGTSAQPDDLARIGTTQEQHRQAINALIQERQELERRVDDLRAFRREYRSRLKAYLEGQLRDLEGDLEAGGLTADLKLQPEELERRVDDLRAFEREYRSRLKAYLEGQLRDLEAGDPAAARDQELASGPEHPDTLTGRANLARWTGQAGDASAARDLYAGLLPVFERVSGPEHPDTLTARANLAYWTGQAGDASAARDLLAGLLPVFERVSGPRHPDTLTARANLAYWTGQAGDASAARDLYAGLLPVFERVSGPRHPDTLTARDELAYWTEKAERDHGTT
jgi:pyruvate/2-oxoglutarate dehydrogenase complex dihydrolipoamide acyltransferase (E2) component